ncbi:MAG: methyltransferase domain-containing protein [Ktedonobacteraceae bacterium]
MDKTQKTHQSGTRRHYLADTESAAELQRLVLQDAMLTDICTPLLAPRLSTVPLSILDIACGPGIWAMRVAKAYPQSHITGTDISPCVIDYARLTAGGDGISNVTFTQADFYHLDQTFHQEQFDFVHVRQVLWHLGLGKEELIRQWATLLKPGGIMRLTDWEASITNSPSFNLLTHYLKQALHAYKRSDSEYCVGIVYQLFPLLRQASFSQIVEQPHYVNFSAGTDFHDVYIQDITQGAIALEKFIVGSGKVDCDTYRACLRESIKEIDSPDFLGGHFFLSVWGVK